MTEERQVMNQVSSSNPVDLLALSSRDIGGAVMSPWYQTRPWDMSRHEGGCEQLMSSASHLERVSSPQSQNAVLHGGAKVFLANSSEVATRKPSRAEEAVDGSKRDRRLCRSAV